MMAVLLRNFTLQNVAWHGMTWRNAANNAVALHGVTARDVAAGVVTWRDVARDMTARDGALHDGT